MRNRFLTIAALGAALMLFAVPAAALDPINADRSGVAIQGFDPVAYFVAGEPVKGDPGIELAWHGATWRFSSAENRASFEASPERYAPKYGGYCAWAVSQKSTADIDPTAWSIVDGALYLNYSTKIRRRWEKDIQGHIVAADANWPELLGRD